ncbi:Regulatory protein MIG1 [Erysiphe necator]|uniref:Putative c2h2 type zinc finger domain containing protein n=1 Tax=Uncinula necator TaxID=52586 RepID=A0A0B1P5I7_UNCNE|nr:Regulatory protein MIG1 [Erysiphe necator]KHJ32186.1 putative c2h2 type zinc finger domain containing protein [Erysiphe necator]
MPLPQNPDYKVAKTKPKSSSATASKQCRFCDRKFSKVEHLKRHERSHTGERPYTCPKCLKSFSRSDVLIRHLKNHPRLSDKEIRNDQSERVVESTNNLLQQVTPSLTAAAASVIATLAPQACTEYSSKSKQDENRQFSVPSNEPITLGSQIPSGLDHLATIASRRDYGGCMMDPILHAESHQAPHEMYEDSINTDQSFNWNQVRSNIHVNFQIDPNLDPRLTQPEEFLQPSDQKKLEVKAQQNLTPIKGENCN